MKGFLYALLALTGHAALVAPQHAAAQSRVGLESLLMPGRVARAHADTETECGACHVRLKNTTQSRLCSDCHEEIGRDVEARTGFHGRISAGESLECRSCHTEHAGRDADIVGLDEDTFDHDTTDYPLRGAHVAVTCQSCHAADRKFREAAAECYACHAEDDPHDGSLGQACADCHSDSGWRDVRFDHDGTKFPLVGKHAAVACNGCHVNERYDAIPTDCYSCHRLDDVHDGTRGAACGNCHAADDWDRPTFDHDRDTAFALDGGHAAIACTACHAQDPYAVELERTCVACHREDDDHRGRHGEKCESCHVSDAWSRVTFDHDTTGFPLHNRHEEIACAGCHRGPVYEVAVDPACYACHETDDAHAGQLGIDCRSCHNDAGWVVDVQFDHDITDFPLLGLHAAVPCERCHLTPKFKDASSSCVECHRDDDVHASTLGPRCSQCHTPAAWELWRFDHDAETDFPLLGAHHGLACDACHRKATTGEIRLSTTCGDCHRTDDVHAGRFGANCGRCHSSDSFQDPVVQP